MSENKTEKGPLAWLQPGTIVRYENRSGTIIPQAWIYPPRDHRTSIYADLNRLRGETVGVLKEGLYLVVGVHSASVRVIVNGRVVELLCPIDLYPV